MQASPGASTLQREYRDQFGAQELQQRPYINPAWTLSAAEYLQTARSLNHTARIFYLRRYFQPAQLPRLVSHVPYVCTAGDAYILTQDGRTYGSRVACQRDHPPLLAAPERRLSRNKCVASFVQVLVVGGYRTPTRVLPPHDRFECAVVSGAGPQFEARYLDHADFIVEKARGADARVTCDRLPAYQHLPRWPDAWDGVEADGFSDERMAKQVLLGNEGLSRPIERLPRFFLINDSRALDVSAFAASIRECMHLWLTAFDALVAMRATGRRAGYFKLVAIGTGFFAEVAGTHFNLGRVLLPLLLHAAVHVLRANGPAYAHIHTVEFPDFSRDDSYSPPPQLKAIDGIRLVAAPFRDVLDFPAEVRDNHLVPGVLNPGDCFAFVGNELDYGSVEAMIGCNSTLRINQNYLWNEHILDPRNMVGVGDPVTAAAQTDATELPTT